MSYADDDWDEPDGYEPPDDEGGGTVPCPYCGEAVYEDAVRCPRCENYISKEDSPPRRQPVWMVLGVLAVLAIVLMWVLRGM
ncbi:MAG TPA: hypothetical protein VJ739_04080 [Gemmataceae bacterium]|nr:hypothetical protein [Gemmataceae bacterium]